MSGLRYIPPFGFSRPCWVPDREEAAGDGEKLDAFAENEVDAESVVDADLWCGVPSRRRPEEEP